VAALYASTTAVLMLAFLSGDNPPDNIRMMLASLAFTAPLGIGAFIVGVLGHFSPRGRRLAGPAVWIVAITPGAAAAFTFFAGVLTRVPAYATLTAAVVAAVDFIAIVELNGRILKASPEERATENTP
jgi:hypothetical protein